MDALKAQISKMSASEIEEAQVSSSSPPCKEQLAHKQPDHTALDAHEPCFFQYFDVQQTRPKAPQLNRPHAAAFTHATAAVAPACCSCLRLLPHHPQEAASRMLLGLSIALEHPALSTDPRILCAAARACNAWREAVQQCQVCSTAVVFHPEATLQSWCS
jgi:hypothetical protein